jgi:hypothetical protein
MSSRCSSAAKTASQALDATSLRPQLLKIRAARGNRSSPSSHRHYTAGAIDLLVALTHVDELSVSRRLGLVQALLV